MDLVRQSRNARRRAARLTGSTGAEADRITKRVDRSEREHAHTAAYYEIFAQALR
ncbi:hypothetical protein ACIRVK_21525 [Streptomyces sp. NPDC101152]|uniref:hypothetical protein n=1 Tax=Streptomyces sp. NPDC101152 TaxID=3366116 RepID=UPI00382E398E